MKSVQEMITTKSVEEMLATLMNSKKKGLQEQENKTFELTTTAEWKKAKEFVMGIPSEIYQAISLISGMPDIIKRNEKHTKSEMKQYTKMINGYEFIFELRVKNESNIIRALLTLYDNTNSICFSRDLMTEPINKM